MSVNKVKYLYPAVAFLTGASVMIFEIAGTRLMAPFFGTSTYVWTSIIGVILGALSIGYWLGGKAADSNPSKYLLSKILVLSGILIAVTYLISTLILTLLLLIPSFIFASFVGAVVLYGPTSILLGMVSPMIARLSLRTIEDSGRTVGNLYAISTFGSIVGTFLTGYVLLPFIGTSIIFINLAITLIVLALIVDSSLLSFRPRVIHVFTLIMIGGFSVLSFSFGQTTVTAEFDTHYSHAQIHTIEDLTGDGRDVQVLQLNAEFHSGMYTDGSVDLVFPYTKYYRLAEYFAPGFTSTLMLGGGAFSFPKFFLNTYSSSTIDVVEIDPMLIKAAYEHFDLKKDPRMQIFTEDGRNFLRSNEAVYDVIYGDAFASFFSIPFHLTTQEATKQIYSALADDGVYIVNVIGSLDGPKSPFFKAYYSTLKTVFPTVHIFPVETFKRNELQNIIFVARKMDGGKLHSTNEPLILSLLEREIAGPKSTVKILTDDHAPVEYLMRKALVRDHN